MDKKTLKAEKKKLKKMKKQLKKGAQIEELLQNLNIENKTDQKQPEDPIQLEQASFSHSSSSDDEIDSKKGDQKRHGRHGYKGIPRKALKRLISREMDMIAGDIF